MSFLLRLPRRPALVAAMLLVQGASHAQAPAESVALAGMLGNRALLIVNGSPPKTVGAGDTHQGVKVISTSGDQAIIEQSGKRITLRVGDAPVSMGGTAGGGGKGNRIVLPAGQGGHFFAAGSVNGRAAQFMVDTGATAIAMSTSDADRAGINYKNGQQTLVGTANGTVTAYRVKLDSVRIGDVEIYGVDALVTPSTMPYMLLGNSFLSRFQMTRDNDQMTLTKRY
ncbi:MAG: TIGR02281 family clan AA aspartic protease [Pseudomonadota bacterium]